LEEVQDEVRRLAQNVVGLAAVLLELVIVGPARAAHAFDHLLAQLHRRREVLGIAAENEAKVNVEQVARGRDQEVVQVSIAHAEDVSDDAIPG